MSGISDMIQRLCPEAPPLRRQGWSVPRSRFCSSDNAFRPFPISCVIQILQLASLREPLCANGRHSEQAPSALPKSHKSARAFKRVKTRLAFQRPEGKWAPTYSNFPMEFNWKIGIFQTLIHRSVWPCPEICYICKTKQRLPLQKTSNCSIFADWQELSQARGIFAGL